MFAHKNLKRFYLEGEIYDDSKIPALRERYILLLKDVMTAKGYVRREDIDIDFTLAYNGKTFEFQMSVYGVFVGKKRAQCFTGIDKNREIPRVTMQTTK